MLRRADAAMYSAKEAGKHRFALWTGDSENPAVPA
jgi:PleD family two-component response regulator